MSVHGLRKRSPWSVIMHSRTADGVAAILGNAAMPFLGNCARHGRDSQISVGFQYIFLCSNVRFWLRFDGVKSHFLWKPSFRQCFWRIATQRALYNYAKRCQSLWENEKYLCMHHQRVLTYDSKEEVQLGIVEKMRLSSSSSMRIFSRAQKVSNKAFLFMISSNKN